MKNSLKRGKIMKNKTVKIVLISVAVVVAAALIVFAAVHISANADVASRANEIGEEYGVTDFYSNSTNIFGEVWSLDLHSKDYIDLSEEDKMNLLIDISTDEEMISKLAEERQKEVNPLTGWYLEIISGDDWYTVSVLSDYNMLDFSGGIHRKLENADSYGYVVETQDETVEKTTVNNIGSDNGKHKVACTFCNGTGQVKYYYGDTDYYDMGLCSSCDGKGYTFVKPSGDSGGGTKKICGSCGKYVDRLVTKRDMAGESRTWCSACWSDYDSFFN